MRSRDYGKRKKTITRTFRINDDWDFVLNEEAERQGISANALIDKILRRFALFDRYTDRFEVLNLPNRIFKEVFQLMPNERLTEEGEKHGSLDAVDFFNLLGYPRDYETFIYLITEYFGSSTFSRWFQCFHHPSESQDLFHLQHNLGRKWSVFVDSYLKAILKTITSTKVESRIYEYAVTLRISRPQTIEAKKRSYQKK